MLGYVQAAQLGASYRFSPLELFAAGEQGVWYDPSDFSTLFQDAAGTRPVTSVDQSVGLVLNKSKKFSVGNEILTNPGPNFTTTDTYVSGGSGDSYALIDGKIRLTTGGVARLQTSFPSKVGGRYRISWNFVAGTAVPNLKLYSNNNGSGELYTNDSLSGSVDISVYFTTIYLCMAQTVAGNSFLISFSVKEIDGNNAYQSGNIGYRPLLKQDANGKYYLLFDGSNDYLVTPSIDFTATDKMTVLAGVRKLSDAANARVIAELSVTTASNNGSFALQGPDAAGAATYLWQNKGTSLTDAQATSLAAPNTRVLTGIGDIAGDSAILRVNGIQADSDTGDQGTGNYGNYPFYIGARGGSSLYFAGHLYSLIVRGAATADAQLINAERYVGQQTGVAI